MGSRSCTICAYIHSEDYYPYGTLYCGMGKNDDVAALQRKLIDLKFLKDRADGIFGKKTEQAVRDYQKWAGFEVTGVAYPQTLNAVGSSWEEKMAPSVAPTPEPTEAPVEYPPCCTYAADESGAAHAEYCALHASIHQASEQLLAEARTDAAAANAWRITRSMWSAELDSLYASWKNALPPGRCPGLPAIRRCLWPC